MCSFENDDINKLYKIWSLIFLIVIIDIIFELIFKFNILGFSSFMPGRIASFSGDELNIGHFFSGFCLIFISFIFLNYKNTSIQLIIAFFLIALSFLIGERSNFIKSLLIILSFVFLVYEMQTKYKIFSIITLISFIVLISNLNPGYKLRYIDQFTKILANESISYYFENSVYGAHYNVAFEIFKDNKIFGVGIKNFRTESYSKKYNNLDHKFNDRRANTHPHQIHFEFLSETGLFGYFTFAIFIFYSLYLCLKNYLKKKNLYQLSGMLFVIINLLPLLPSGSFFSTYTSGLFWLNYAVMVGYLDKSN